MQLMLYYHLMIYEINQQDKELHEYWNLKKEPNENQRFIFGNYFTEYQIEMNVSFVLSFQ